MKKWICALLLMPLLAQGRTFRVANATITCDSTESRQVVRAIGDLKHDIAMVTGKTTHMASQIVVGTYGSKTVSQLIAKGVLKEQDLKDKWESYVITVTRERQPRLVIAGSDKRGTIYGIYDVSQRIGVSPWYWWADVPVRKNAHAAVDCDYYASGEPTVKYRGIFINDEDWGLKPWAANNFEKELGDIGPKTYAKVCELLLRLKANMLAPAMHSCTGAFYSHPESKLVADSFGIIITTSHCEPLLLNNAAKTEWDEQADGDWNYQTNSSTILRKWDSRLQEASPYENIYTMAMRGVHDAGLRGNLSMQERVPLIGRVISDQRRLLERHIGKPASQIPQIFVPYKETMDIYENGLQLPDDITLVWVDDNYGYMKRVSSPQEQKRSGGAGVYYHLSYLGTPHDYLWLNTTPPVLMYEELKKAYDHGADRYWLLNVGDIKPMELGMQTFMDMAWDISQFTIENVNRHQAKLLESIFGQGSYQYILDTYLRLAWSRKPEYMGWEYEWDSAHPDLAPTEFSFQNYSEAQQRLADYRRISDMVEQMADGSPAFFELVQFPVQAACQMNRKFLMAQLNQELLAAGRKAEANWAARQMEAAYDSIETLNRRYNELLGGKWRGMMTVPPGFCALYQNKPQVVYTPAAGEQAPDLDPRPGTLNRCMVLNLAKYAAKSPQAGLVKGIGYDWQAMQLGQVTYQLPRIPADSIEVVFSILPFWPLYKGRDNAIVVSVDGSRPQVFRNKFEEWGASWKDQVVRNGVSTTMRFAVDRHAPHHQLSFRATDTPQILQKVIVNWGGLKISYLGPSSAIEP